MFLGKRGTIPEMKDRCGRLAGGRRMPEVLWVRYEVAEKGNIRVK